jgi:hypothetical protein
MILEDIKDTYATKDLHLAAFLQVKGMVIKKLEQFGGNKTIKNPVYFIFSDTKRCQELENIFWGGTGEDIMINAKDYFTAIRDLRGRANSITSLINKKEVSFKRKAGE